MYSKYRCLFNLVSYDKNQSLFKVKIENCIGLKIGVLSMKYIYSVIKFTKIYNLLDSKIKHFR